MRYAKRSFRKTVQKHEIWTYQMRSSSSTREKFEYTNTNRATWCWISSERWYITMFISSSNQCEKTRWKFFWSHATCDASVARWDSFANSRSAENLSDENEVKIDWSEIIQSKRKIKERRSDIDQKQDEKRTSWAKAWFSLNEFENAYAHHFE